MGSYSKCTAELLLDHNKDVTLNFKVIATKRPELSHQLIGLYMRKYGSWERADATYYVQLKGLNECHTSAITKSPTSKLAMNICSSISHSKNRNNII